MSKIEIILLVLCAGNTIINVLLLSWFHSYAKHSTSLFDIYNELHGSHNERLKQIHDRS